MKKSLSRLLRLLFLSQTLNPLFSVANAENIAILAWMPEHIPLLSELSGENTPFFVLARDRAQRIPAGALEKLASSAVCYVDDINKDKLGITRCLRQFAQSSGPLDRLIHGPSDEQILLAGQLRDEFSIAHGWRYADAQRFADKYAMKSFLTKADPSIKTARFLHWPGASVEEIKSSLIFPLIIKPLQSTASLGIKVVASSQELETMLYALDRTSPHIIEEFISGETLRIDGAVANGKVESAISASYQPSCLEFFGQGKPRVIASDLRNKNRKTIEEFTQAVIAALQLDNAAFHLEALWHNDELYFIEIAARLGGGGILGLFKEKFSTDYFSWFYRAQFGEKISGTSSSFFAEDYAILSFPCLPITAAPFQKITTVDNTVQRSELSTLVRYDSLKIGDSIDLPKRDGVSLALANFYFVGDRQQIQKDISYVKEHFHIASTAAKPHVLALAWAAQDTNFVDHERYEVSYIIDPLRRERDKAGIFAQLPAQRLCEVKDLKEDLEGILACGKKLAAENGQVDLVLSFGMNEKMVFNAAALRDLLGVKVGMSSKDALAFVDKSVMKKRLQENNPSIPTAQFFNLSRDSFAAIPEKLVFPLVIKPRRESASRGVLVVKDRQTYLDEGAKRLARDGDDYWLVEQYIAGRTFRIDGYVSKGEVKIAVPGLYESSCFDYYTYGCPQVTSSFLTVVERDKVSSFTAAVIAAMDLREGVFHLEAIFAENQFYFLEIAARPGGGSIKLLREHFNFDLSRYYIVSQLQLPLAPPAEVSASLAYAHVDFPTQPPSFSRKQRVKSIVCRNCVLPTLVWQQLNQGLEVDLQAFSGMVIPVADFLLVGDSFQVQKDKEAIVAGTSIELEALP